MKWLGLITVRGSVIILSTLKTGLARTWAKNHLLVNPCATRQYQFRSTQQELKLCIPLGTEVSLGTGSKAQVKELAGKSLAESFLKAFLQAVWNLVTKLHFRLSYTRLFHSLLQGLQQFWLNSEQKWTINVHSILVNRFGWYYWLASFTENVLRPTHWCWRRGSRRRCLRCRRRWPPSGPWRPRLGVHVCRSYTWVVEI